MDITRWHLIGFLLIVIVVSLACQNYSDAGDGASNVIQGELKIDASDLSSCKDFCTNLNYPVWDCSVLQCSAHWASPGYVESDNWCKANTDFDFCCCKVN